MACGFYLGRKDGRAGIEALPHREFWAEAWETVPADVARGVWDTRNFLSSIGPLAFLKPAGPAPPGPGGKSGYDEINVEDPLRAPGRSSRSRPATTC